MDHWIEKAKERIAEAEKNGTLTTIEIELDEKTSVLLREMAKEYDVSESVVIVAALLSVTGDSRK
jgi:predicted O-methyltransferase YrrM